MTEEQNGELTYINFKISRTEKKLLLEEMKKDGYEKLSTYMRAIVRKVIA